MPAQTDKKIGFGIGYDGEQASEHTTLTAESRTCPTDLIGIQAMSYDMEDCGVG
jgi:hypothetical protein